jgi:hypothetical protein
MPTAGMWLLNICKPARLNQAGQLTLGPLWCAYPQVQREETEAFEVGGTGVTRREAAGANAGSKRDPSVIQTLLNQISHEDVIAKMKIQARIYAACMQKLLQVGK